MSELSSLSVPNIYDAMSFKDYFRACFDKRFSNIEDICPEEWHCLQEDVDELIHPVLRCHRKARVYLTAHLLHLNQSSASDGGSDLEFSSVSLDKLSVTLGTKGGPDKSNKFYASSYYGKMYLQLLDRYSAGACGFMCVAFGATTPSEY